MKAVIVADNLMPSEMILAGCKPLQEAGYELETLDWVTADRDDMMQRIFNIEAQGPEAEPPAAGLTEAVRDADILVTHQSPIPRSVIEAGRKLKLIGVFRGGYENIAVDAATKYGVPVFHTAGRNANAVAEITIALILAEMRNIARSHATMRAGEWFDEIDVDRPMELTGRTVGLVGFGTIGRMLAHRVSGFEVQLLVHDPYVPAATIRAAGGEKVSLETLLREADVVSLHVRLSPETMGLIGQDEIKLMKPTAYLINTARAGVLDQAALVEALQQERIAGAALDVFWEEPIPSNSPLFALDNLTMTSHLGGTTDEAFRDSVDILVTAILNYFHHGDVNLVVNPEALRQSRP